MEAPTKSPAIVKVYNQLDLIRLVVEDASKKAGVPIDRTHFVIGINPKGEVYLRVDLTPLSKETP